jgi:hypothetical protein
MSIGGQVCADRERGPSLASAELMSITNLNPSSASSLAELYFHFCQFSQTKYISNSTAKTIQEKPKSSFHLFIDLHVVFNLYIVRTLFERNGSNTVIMRA